MQLQNTFIPLRRTRELKTQLENFFKHRILSPQMDRLDHWKKRVVDLPAATRGNENSPVRFNFSRAGIALEGDHAPLPGFPRSAPQMIGSIINIRKSIYDLEKNPVSGKKQINSQTLGELIRFARDAGASDVGFSQVPQEWVFKDLAIRYTKAIVFTMEMNKARMDLAPNPDTAVMIHETYNQLGQVSNKVAAWLRERGYAAHAGYPLGEMALSPP